ncbi:alkene reductase [Burkholderia gladioli]|uniref:alkene reductase n=1 Tax=Burkholderia gladioli TaxID=28095 RepID=UPI00202F4B5F|nr:alkene reductase [Burkholderia gladioli]URV29924.1 alkene reductase [Burkholderia gladioli]
MPDMPNLFDPIRLGAINASNRLVMAPLTRGRADRNHVPTPLMAEYYAQRASAGLIVSEATGISVEGLGFPYAPGLWNAEQVLGWKVVTDRVHAAGGRMVAQLWHMGRLVHPSFNGGATPVSASDTTVPGLTHTYEGRKPLEPARALRIEEIRRVVTDYELAARNAIAAGFDGVEIHAANGYLIDQFLRDSSNLRTDEYGGSIENRVRFLREVTEAVVTAVGPDRVGVRLSPNGASWGVNDSDPHSLFPVAAAALDSFGLAYLHVREAPPTGRIDSTGGGARDASDVPPVAPKIRASFHGPLILNSDFDGDRAAQALARGEADAISFGRLFIANPDLPRRIREGLPFANIDQATLYTNGREGYADYPNSGIGSI